MVSSAADHSLQCESRRGSVLHITGSLDVGTETGAGTTATATAQQSLPQCESGTGARGRGPSPVQVGQARIEVQRLIS